MTTRRRRPPPAPPPRGRSGRFGLLPPLAMCVSSVKAAQLRLDSHGLPQDACESAAFGRSLEALNATAGVRAPARLGAAGHEHALVGRETQELTLRRAPAAAGATPLRNAYEDSSSAVGSTGIPAGTSSGSASSVSTTTSSVSASSA